MHLSNFINIVYFMTINFLEKSLWTETKINFYQNDAKIKEGGKEQSVIQSILHHLSNTLLWHGHVWLLIELGHWCLLMV